MPAGWKPSDVPLQRVHDVEARHDGYYVRLRDQGDRRSDKYAFRADCARGLGGNNSRRRHSGHRVGGDGHLPSGNVFQRMLGR